MLRRERHEIHVKGGFSENKVIKHLSDILQIDSLNDRTRNRIYNVNYKIVGENIVDIIDEHVISGIEETLVSPYDIVKKHYNKAIEKLYQEKDFDNSIKESINSVEAMYQVITSQH